MNDTIILDQCTERKYNFSSFLSVPCLFFRKFRQVFNKKQTFLETANISTRPNFLCVAREDQPTRDYMMPKQEVIQLFSRISQRVQNRGGRS